MPFQGTIYFVFTLNSASKQNTVETLFSFDSSHTIILNRVNIDYVYLKRTACYKNDFLFHYPNKIQTIDIIIFFPLFSQ